MENAIKEPFDFWPQPAVISRNRFEYKSLSEWALNISIGCTHGCRFCYVPSTSTKKLVHKLSEYQIQDPGEQWGDYSLLRTWDEKKFLSSLRSANKILPKDLTKGGHRAVILCSTTDPYQTLKASTLEKTKQLNESALAMVEKALIAIRDKSTINVRILTRSPLAKEHFALYKTFGNRLVFGMSLPTLNNRLARVYEPNAPAPSLRLKALKAAKKAGLHVYVAMAPTYPECDEADLRKTLEAIKELEPITIFHEPINIRAENIARINQYAASLEPPVQVNTEVFATANAWRRYAMDSLVLMQKLATEMGLRDRLHLWPDPDLASKTQYLRIISSQRKNLTPPLKKLANEQDEKRYNEKYYPWIQRWWNRVSEWPDRTEQ